MLGLCVLCSSMAWIFLTVHSAILPCLPVTFWIVDSYWFLKWLWFTFIFFNGILRFIIMNPCLARAILTHSQFYFNITFYNQWIQLYPQECDNCWHSHECSHDTCAADGEHIPCCDLHQVLLHSMQIPGTFPLQQNHKQLAQFFPSSNTLQQTNTNINEYMAKLFIYLHLQPFCHYSNIKLVQNYTHTHKMNTNYI